MKKTACHLVLLLILFAVSDLFCGITGKVAGRIIDATTREPLPGTNIFLEGTNLGASADLEGYYYIINIPPGKYNIIARCMGFGAKRLDGIRVSVDATNTLNFELSTTTIEGEEVTVVAERSLIQKDLTSTTARVSSDDIKLLPLESVGQVVNLQAGVVAGHFRGGRLGEVSYMIDGIAVNDGYNRSQMINLEPNSIAEIEVISGTFNAEYGQAMSGVVNIVSKEPERKFSGQISAYSGAYLSNRKTPFVVKNGDGIKREDYTEEELSYYDMSGVGDIYDIQGNLSGPVYSDKLFFFTSMRYNKDDGHYYGKRIFAPSDSSFLPGEREDWMVDANGDGELVAMNRASALSMNGKLIAKPFVGHKLTYNFIYDDDESHGYSHKYKYNPDGLPTSFAESFSHMFHYDYVINQSGFVNIKLANFKKDYKSYVYESPYDLRYVSDTRFQIGSGPHFYMAGTAMGHSYRTSKSMVFKTDLTYQVDRYNQVKMGVQAKKHDIFVNSFSVRLDRITDWLPRPVDQSSPSYIDYTKKPKEFSAYIQDRIEWSYFVMNIGLRYDWFDPNSVYPSDLNNPSTSEKLDSSIKKQFSPRFGIALPVSEHSVLHLSYGLFFQIPEFSALYLNPDFRIPVTSFAQIGNSDLEPEKTSHYELGLQHEVTRDVALDLSVYYKDVRNLLGMETYTMFPSFTRYARYVNRDYGQVFGFTAALEQRSGDFLTTTIDYTYMIAEGNASDPNDVYLKSLTSPPTEITKELILLNWDRTHSLNLTATAHDKDRWNLGVVGTFASGFPYTGEKDENYYGKPNSERKPFFINFDLNFSIAFNPGGLRTTFFSNIYNVFDIENDIDIYTDSGNASYTRSMQRKTDDMVTGINTINDYYYRPDYRSAPRKVVAGFRFEF